MNLKLIIELKNLSYHLSESPILTDISLRLDCENCFYLCGVNGAGKTTLIKLLAGLLAPNVGSIYKSPGISCDRTLYIGHRASVSSDLTVIENIRWRCSLADRTMDNVSDLNIESALHLLEIGKYKNELCSSLSEGQLRKVALSVLFVRVFDVCLLDEPFTSLDAKSIAKIEARINELVKLGALVILTSHQPPSLEKMKVIELRNGRIESVRREVEAKV